MRALLLAVICFAQVSLAFGRTPILNSVVLGVSLDPDIKTFHFPCNAGPADVVFCDERVSIQDTVCSKTLSFKHVSTNVVDVNCQLSSGRSITLARTIDGFIPDHTQDAFGYVRLQFNPVVKVKTVQERTEVNYVLIVE